MPPNLIFSRIEVRFRKCADDQDVVCDRFDRAYEIACGALGKCFSDCTDDSNKRERGIEDTDPCVGFVFDVARGRAALSIGAEEQSA